MPEADADLALIAEAAQEAGEIAMRYFDAAPRAWDKPDDAGPVTEADMAIDAMLRARLMAARPGYGWLSEETEDDSARLAASRVFIVDPIDGTRAFMAGAPDWGHSIAIAERGEIIAAAVFLPRHARLFTAARGRGAFRGDAPLRCSACAEAGAATILTPKRSLDPAHWQGGNAPEITRAYRSSLAYRLCLVAEGRFDGMMTLRPTWEWDVAAGSLIAQEAGAAVMDLAGAPPRFNNATPQLSGLFAGPAPLCAALQGRLAT